MLFVINSMIRNTAPIGWIPLLLIKILYEKSFKAFFISGLTVGLLTLGICIGIDSLYYGGTEIVITPYNFLKVNVLHNLSKHFGDDESYKYILIYLPTCFSVVYPVLLYGLYYFY